MWLNNIDKREYSLIREELVASNRFRENLTESLSRLDVEMRHGDGIQLYRAQGAAQLIAEILSMCQSRE